MNQRFFIILITCAVVFSFSQVALAEIIKIPNPLCLNGPADKNCVKDLPGLIDKIADYITSVIGALAGLMFLIAGIMYIVSAGDPGKAGRAKTVAIYAAVGLGIALAGKGLIVVIKAVVGV
ncbi:MAG: hypothetical protein A3D44_03450 [Candidatus Staskawiczbacteria bacterium RIFCSPHIGHO2_02_FULL_42_22]|uniref:Uncharacterized protein n=1 Tax=Candidatus Staskawiczbacteria bacterium RIFCSPHIGHO2_02_FULL_42_22 TaxID=1802207 RepID=A0A1G2I3P0_9BACT|nr:MAG: hypothetical protein A3D44_03450 [Candidatus Staskawiczbacteria bacterium RIFCSPHIGHO2_02_FULL_42_22]